MAPTLPCGCSVAVPILSTVRTYLTILRLLRSICVGACLLWTDPAYAVDTLTGYHARPDSGTLALDNV